MLWPVKVNSCVCQGLLLSRVSRNSLCVFSVATASATFSPRHASPAPGPSYVTPQDISPSISPSPSPLHLPPRPAPPSLPHHQQIHDDDILPLPLPADQNDSPYADSEPQAQPAHAQQRQEQQQKGKTHRRRLVGGMASSHLTVDSEYQCVRLAVLGAPGVGKSAIVTQFVMQTFPEEYVPTEQRQVCKNQCGQGGHLSCVCVCVVVCVCVCVCVCV